MTHGGLGEAAPLLNQGKQDPTILVQVGPNETADDELREIFI